MEDNKSNQNQAAEEELQVIKRAKVEQKSQDPQRREDHEYKPMGRPDISVEELNRLVYKRQLYIDQEGFYCYGDGSFYDPDGFFFDVNGYDKYGGYYDDYGQYVPGEGYENEYYETEHQDDDDHGYDEDEKVINEYLEYDENDDVQNQQVLADKKLEEDQEFEKEAEIAEHVIPAIQWLKAQPEGKNYTVQIENLPVSANEKHFILLLKKNCKSFKEDKVKIKYDKVHSQGWVHTSDKNLLIQMLYLHYTYLLKYRIESYILGYSYDGEILDEQKFADEFEKRLLLSERQAQNESQSQEATNASAGHKNIKKQIIMD